MRRLSATDRATTAAAWPSCHAPVLVGETDNLEINDADNARERRCKPIHLTRETFVLGARFMTADFFWRTDIRHTEVEGT